MSQKARVQAAIRQHQKKLDAEFNVRVRAGVKEALEASVLPHYNKSKAHYDAVVKGRKGIFTDAEYNLILHCTHADSRKSMSEERLNQAFQLLQKKKLVLVAEKENPTEARDVPLTFAEMMARR